jgi:hypothetical protein
MTYAVGSVVININGEYMVLPPERCPAGHALGPNRVLVGFQPCRCDRHGHTTWCCRQCDSTVYGPPLDSRCRVLNGAG